MSSEPTHEFDWTLHPIEMREVRNIASHRKPFPDWAKRVIFYVVFLPAGVIDGIALFLSWLLGMTDYGYWLCAGLITWFIIVTLFEWLCFKD